MLKRVLTNCAALIALALAACAADPEETGAESQVDAAASGDELNEAPEGGSEGGSAAEADAAIGLGDARGAAPGVEVAADAAVDDGSPESDAAPAPDAATDVAAEVISGDRFADIYRDIFATNGCNSPYCHHGFSLEIPAGNAEDAWQELLDARAESRPCGPETGEMRILVPGDPESSLLYLKVAPGVEVCGDKMPLSANRGTGLAPELAERVRAWIAAGAAR